VNGSYGVDFADRDPSWSPDGRRIAFVYEDTNTYANEVMVIKADGSGGRALGAGAEPAWAPGKPTVAWGDDGRSRNGIRVANADGSGRRRIAADVYHSPVAIRRARTGALIKRFETPGRAVGIAASSRYVAVVDWISGSKYQLRRYRPDGRFLGAAQLAKRASSVLGGARALIYNAGGDIFAVDALTGKKSLIARPVAFAGGLSILNRRVVWTESAGRNRTRIRAIDLPR
jgi:hypothetical protein